MIAIIGGSGFYNFIEDMKINTINTPYGPVMYEQGIIDGKTVFFIPRHGKKHSIPPSQINYRANIFATHMLKSDAIIATNAVGSIRENVPPGSFIIPDNIIDLTSGRLNTFFDDGDISITTNKGKILSGVVHVDVSNVFDTNLRNLLEEASKLLGIKIKNGGTLVTTNGPRFETPAEIKAYGLLGADFVGMTSSPEVFLAKELEIPYATFAVVTNFGAGLQKTVTADEVFALFKNKISEVKKVIQRAITLI